MPSQEAIQNLADGPSMFGACEKASPEELMLGPFAIVDHILLETCCGQKNNFHEANQVCAKFCLNWAQVCKQVFWELSEVANVINNKQGLEEEFTI